MSKLQATPQVLDAARRLAPCQRLLVICGAGASADAGVPTFRGAGGLWRDHSAEELASPAGFMRNPDLVWEWYRERREQISRCDPHAGQRSLALLQQMAKPPAQVLIATTNEDDLLERAGVRDVLHLHGSLFDTRCAGSDGSTGCGFTISDRGDNAASFLPCPHCGALVRPGSVWFGEPLTAGSMEKIARFNADGCLLVGSSSLVQPVAGIAPDMSLAGLPVVDVNNDETPMAHLPGQHLRGPSVDLLPVLVDLITSDAMRAQAERLLTQAAADAAAAANAPTDRRPSPPPTDRRPSVSPTDRSPSATVPKPGPPAA